MCICIIFMKVGDTKSKCLNEKDLNLTTSKIKTSVQQKDHPKTEKKTDGLGKTPATYI